MILKVRIVCMSKEMNNIIERTKNFYFYSTLLISLLIVLLSNFISVIIYNCTSFVFRVENLFNIKNIFLIIYKLLLN